MSAWSLGFHHANAHGVLAAFHLVDGPEPVPADVLARLPIEEQAFAATLRGYRQGQFVAGRFALRAACEQLGLNAPPLLPDDRGAPRLPAGWTGSISHKGDLAVGMVARAGQGRIGIDLEDYGPPRPSIARRILTPAELALVEALPDERRWFAILIRFSVKEAIYKALDPYVRRYVGFDEAEVDLDPDGRATVRLTLARGEGPFLAEARYEWLRGRLLASARIRRPADVL